MITPEEITQRFTYHEPDQAARLDHEAVNELFLETALKLLNYVPMSRGLSLAVTKLEEARMWANQGIATKGGQR